MSFLCGGLDLIFFLSVIEVVSTLPLGYLSDKYGRKLVLYLNLIVAILGYAWILLVGQFDQFDASLRLYSHPRIVHARLTISGAALVSAPKLPIEAIFVAPFLRLLGGGSIVATTNLFAILADTTGDEAQR